MSKITEYQERYTYEDYKSWQGDWELIDGHAFAMTPSPGFTHQRIVVRLARLLDEELDRCPGCYVLIETDWIINDYTVVRPDVFIICGHSGEKIVKTPKLIFEVVSRESSRRDEILKFELYRLEGVEYYGLVYPELKKTRLFKLVNETYMKVGDFTDETYSLTVKDCNIKIDFGRIWTRD